MDEGEDGGELRPACEAGAALLLGAHEGAAGGAEGCDLGREILLGGRGSGVADASGCFVHFGFA